MWEETTNKNDEQMQMLRDIMDEHKRKLLLHHSSKLEESSDNESDLAEADLHLDGEDPHEDSEEMMPDSYFLPVP